jgi:lipid A 3-O-deacylase
LVRARRAGRLAWAALTFLWLAMPVAAAAHEMLVTFGQGPQPGADQDNETAGLDYRFKRFTRSERQYIDIGVSYTYLRTDATTQRSLYAISVYPQITLVPGKTSRIAGSAPPWAEPYFFVRALAPSYISENALGTRKQAEHFAFQAQVGVGVVLNPGRRRQTVLTISWKHFSNANIFSDNDGIDVPLVLQVGARF